MHVTQPGMTVIRPGPLTTVQDIGRPGQAGWGIPRSGACDRASFALANRLVGNRPDAAVLEATFGGLVLRAEADLLFVSTGAHGDCPAHNAPMVLGAGQELRIDTPAAGLRTYVAVRGGFEVSPVLGSRSTDMLSGLGPAPLTAGEQLPVGSMTAGDPPGVDVAPVSDPVTGDLSVHLLPGPRRDWFTPGAWQSMLAQRYVVTPESNRVGIRLDGEPLERQRDGELPTEGMVRGAVQVPPSGVPILFLADHPVTGGYPVIGYVVDEDVDRCGQLRPGQGLRFSEVQ